jgi:excisionase family DNA binding protein
MQFHNWDNVPIMLSVKQVAEVLGVSRASVYAMLKEDKLPKTKVGKTHKISKEALRRWIENSCA